MIQGPAKYAAYIPPHPVSWMTAERHPMVTHRLHPVFSQFTVHTGCAMASKSCSKVNHRSTCSPSSHPAFLFHQEPLFMTMGVSCFLLSEQHYTDGHDFSLIDSTEGGTLDACSKGYCLDEYSTAEVRSLNSQVNE